MDRQRLEVMKQVVDGRQSIQWAAAKLKKSERTIKRYKARLEVNPEDDLIHKNRGRSPVNKLNGDKIWKLYREKYFGLNVLFFCEKLEKVEGIKASDTFVRKLLDKHDVFSPQAWHRTRNAIRKRLRKLQKLNDVQKEVMVSLETEKYTRTVHPSQPRSKYFGEELQMDACLHHWFGTVKSQLHLAIDDATGIIVGAWFDWQETRSAYYEVTRQFLVRYGIPCLIKTDKRTVFEYENRKVKDEAEDTMTQYQHVCRTLGVELRCSSIPQFKPRVERSFKTLQGRLPEELKEAGVQTIGQANEFLKSYLPKFNEQFAITECIESCWGMQPSEEQIEQTLVTFAKRTVDCGNGIKINCKYYATFDKDGSQVFIQPKTKVSVITTMNGEVYALHNDRLLVLEQIPERQKKSEAVDFDYKKTVQRKKYIPSYDSIWRITNSNFFKKKSNFVKT